MKHTMLVLFVAAAMTAGAQDINQSEVPSVALSAFQIKFPAAKSVEWEKKGDLFKVEFEISRTDHEAWIDQNGHIVKHIEELSTADIPQSISAKLKSDFKDYKIDDVEKVEADGKTFYVIDLDGKSGDREITFNAEGGVQQ